VSPLASLLSWLVFLVAAPFLFFHPRVSGGWRTRLALDYLPPRAPTRGVPRGAPEGRPSAGPGPRVWMHGASAGDVLGLVPIIRELNQLRPDVRVVVTAMTDSGAEMAEQRLRATGLCEAVAYAPWDLPGPCRRTVAWRAPDVLVLEYTELWPQLIWAASSAGARLVLTNGRIGPSNQGRYRLLFAVTGNLLAKFDLLLMRTEEEADRAVALGAPAAIVRVTGNTKFDALSVSVPDEPDAALRAALRLGNEPLWVCGSTHEREEELLLDVYRRLRRELPRLRILLAPRYVERAGRIAQLARQRGLECRLRSQLPGDEPVVVLDTIGDLVRAYTLATIVFVGGSFTRRGGQNILEPAACGKPVLFGPHMENFRDSVQVLVGRGGLEVKSPAALERLVRELLGRPDELAKLGAMARQATAAVRGASVRDAQLIAELLPPREGRAQASGP
jgi:3-deoxy-D-manno-octulosonic-acid transferase